MKTFESPICKCYGMRFFDERFPPWAWRGVERERAEEGPTDEKGRILPTA